MTREAKCGSAIVMALLFLSVTGCSFVRPDRESLNKFAVAYVDCRKAMNAAEVLSWVIALDQSEDVSEGTTYYRRSFVDALNTRASNQERAAAARDALKYFNTKSKQALAEFSDDDATLDDKSLALVEAAGAIRDEEHRKEATQVAATARDIQQQLDTLTRKVGDIYDLQQKLMNTIADNNGDLRRSFGTMKDQIPQKQKLDAEAEELRNKEQSLTRIIQERYAAFKGMTGITLDYVEATSNDNAKQK
jgi:hypothetical protein